jgi:hypothetical protein
MQATVIYIVILLLVSMATESKTFLFSAIVTCHFLFALYWVHHFIIEMRTNIRKKMPSIYLAVFLCCRK